MAERILVIDDEPRICRSLRAYFAARGCEVDCASGLKEAKERLRTAVYAVVITDLSLDGARGTEGLEIAAFVRAQGCGTQVILLTGYGSPETEAEARRRGVVAIFAKPQPLAELARVVAELNRNTARPSAPLFEKLGGTTDLALL